MDDAGLHDACHAKDPVCRASTNTAAKIHNVALRSPEGIAPQGIDSGYGSTASSATSEDGIEMCTRHASQLYRRHVTKLKYFNNDKIPIPVWQRFCDLKELYAQDFLSHLEKRKVNTHTLSIKLRCLGKTEATAKPYIVIQCDKAASRSVNQFFNQQHVKTISALWEESWRV